MPEDGPILVHDTETDQYGLFRPSDSVVETHVGGECVEMPAETLPEHIHEADEAELQASLEADIQEVREEIEELREQDLTDEQARELDRLESRLEQQESVLEFVAEVDDA